jgi:polyisoprenoid-binding protein YceI
MNTKIILAGILLIAVGGFYAVVTRPVVAPSGELPEAARKLDPNSDAADARFTIDALRSTASFEIDEVLRGAPLRVVGTTSDISGSFGYKLGDGTLSLGDISVNARTLKTDRTNRDGAISRLILKSGETANEFITFSPTSVLKVGEGYSVTGDLTVSGITKPVTFEVKLDRIVETEISGTAVATISRKDFGLVIPSIPFVADVPDLFQIKASIVAVSI